MMDLKHYLSSSSGNPRQILKIVLSFAVIMLVLWLFMISRMDYGEETSSIPATQERTESLRSALNQTQAGESQSENRTPNIFLNAFTTFMVLIALLGLVWLWSRKKSQLGKEQELLEIGGHMLGQGAQLKIVEINKEIWVIGVTSGSVNLLHRYPKSEWSGQIKQPESEEKSFYQIFRGKI